MATVKKRQVAGFSGVKKKSGTQRSSGAVRLKSVRASEVQSSNLATPEGQKLETQLCYGF